MKLFCFAFMLFTNAAFAQDKVKISGNIQHQLSDSIEISFNTNRIAYYPNEYFARVDKHGKFSLAFPVPHGIYTQATIKHGNKIAELVIQSGDSLAMTVDAAHFDSTIHYKGKGAATENFIALHTIKRGLTNQYMPKIKELLYKEPPDFLNEIGREEKTETDLLDKNKAGLPTSFISYWTAYYRYYNYFFIQQYPQVHEMLKKRKYTDTIPMGNYVVVDEMPYAFNDSLLQVSPYLLYLTGVFDIKLKAAGYSYFMKDTMRKRELEDSVNILAYRLLPDKSAEYFAAQNIYGRAPNQPIERTHDQLAVFKKHWPQSEYLSLLTRRVSMAESLAPGQPAPDIDITTQGGKTTRLSDLKGKVVYLSFWSSTCKQCVGEMISERKIKTLLGSKPVAFVYVSIDNNAGADSIIIAKYKITGLFKHTTGEWNAKEVGLYGVQGLPAYFLIDEDGRFAIQNPATPMQPTELILEIEKLLK